MVEWYCCLVYGFLIALNLRKFELIIITEIKCNRLKTHIESILKTNRQKTVDLLCDPVPQIKKSQFRFIKNHFFFFISAYVCDHYFDHPPYTSQLIFIKVNYFYTFYIQFSMKKKKTCIRHSLAIFIVCGTQHWPKDLFTIDYSVFTLQDQI